MVYYYGTKDRGPIWFGQSTHKMSSKNFLKLLASWYPDRPMASLEGSFLDDNRFEKAIWYTVANSQDPAYGRVTVEGLPATHHRVIALTEHSSLTPLVDTKKEVLEDIWPTVNDIDRHNNLDTVPNGHRVQFTKTISIQIPDGYSLWNGTDELNNRVQASLGKEISQNASYRSEGSDYGALSIAFWLGNPNLESEKEGVHVGRISSKEIDKNIEERMRDKAIKDSLIARIKAHPEIYPNYNPIDEYNEKTIWYMLDHLKGKLTIEPSDYLRDKESNKESLYFDGTLYSDNLGYYYVQIYGVTDSAKEKMNLELLDKIIKSISFTAMDVPLGAVRVK